MAFMINQVYVLYFNSKPANISLPEQPVHDGGIIQVRNDATGTHLILLPLWAQYVMPLMGFNAGFGDRIRIPCLSGQGDEMRKGQK
jgi:hypothetical protein